MITSQSPQYRRGSALALIKLLEFPRLFAAALLMCSYTSQGQMAETPRDRSDCPGAGRQHEFPVVEMRRYTLKEGERDHFALYFDTFFPEAHEQLGGIVFGEFLERDQPSHFLWFRGFKDLNSRAIVEASLYYGPVWQEHREKMNSLLLDNDNVMLLKPLDPCHGLPVWPSVDPVTGADRPAGVAIAQVFAVLPQNISKLADSLRTAVASYRVSGAEDITTLVSLDATNNFPQLALRTDGPFLVWLGIVRDESRLNSEIIPVLRREAVSLRKAGLSKTEPETMVLAPTARSRLR